MRWDQAREAMLALLPEVLKVSDGKSELVLVTGNPELYQAVEGFGEWEVYLPHKHPHATPTVRVRVPVFDLNVLAPRWLDLPPAEFLALDRARRFGAGFEEHPVRVSRERSVLYFETLDSEVKPEILELARRDRS